MEKPVKKQSEFKSESSIIVHPIQYQKDNGKLPKFPTWSLVATLIVTFFILKGFIYLKDEKRHGK